MFILHTQVLFVSRLSKIAFKVRGVAMKFPEWFYYKHTYVLSAY